jgi:hypothetical protein
MVMSSNLKVMETKSIYFKNLEELLEVFLVDERNKKNALTLGNKTGFYQFKTKRKIIIQGLKNM